MRITASGAYYWRYLVRSFAYLDLVYVDTPLDDKRLAERLGDVAHIVDLSVRFDRVRSFLEYLQKCEADELIMAIRRDGAYRTPLVPEIRAQIEVQIEEIRLKTGVSDLDESDTASRS